MLRAIYRGLWWLVAPLAVLRLVWRSRKERGYREHIGERFGFGPGRALARDVLRAGYTALVDATFLSHARRARFFALARELGVPVYVLDFHASRACLERRVDARAPARDDH